MSFKKLASWLITDAGKKFSYYAAGTATSVIMLGHVLPNSIFIDRYKDIVHLYKNGFSVPLPPKLNKRFQKALELAEVDERDRHLYKPFSAYGFDIFSAGSSYSQYGVIIGIPANFAYESVDSVDRSAIKLRDNSIGWDLEEGQLLLKSLVLSENAQIYAMAREIKYRQTVKPLLDTVVSVLSCTGAYGLGSSINERLKLFAGPRSLRVILYCIVGTFAFGSYALITDFSQVYYEDRIDKELKKNPVFAEGGKEFYSKVLQRNIALRKLLGKEGERMYTILGNENYYLRYKHIPLVQRKESFESLEQAA